MENKSSKSWKFYHKKLPVISKENFIIRAEIEILNNKLGYGQYVEKTHILTMIYRSDLTIFSIDNQHEKWSKKNAMGCSTTAYFPS
jgi:hypothetical protein